MQPAAVTAQLQRLREREEVRFGTEAGVLVDAAEVRQRGFVQHILSFSGEQGSSLVTMLGSCCGRHCWRWQNFPNLFESHARGNRRA